MKLALQVAALMKKGPYKRGASSRLSLLERYESKGYRAKPSSRTMIRNPVTRVYSTLWARKSVTKVTWSNYLFACAVGKQKRCGEWSRFRRPDGGQAEPNWSRSRHRKGILHQRVWRARLCGTRVRAL